jgi:hypothetical protein
MSLIHIWAQKNPLNTTPGLIVQGVLAGIPLIWFYTMRPRAKTIA